eukprot:10316782-Alexandrium_andersonii.AAC.1
MSASLVGSEMCIRDSLAAPLTTVILERAAGPSWLAGAATMQGWRRYHDCLLYTSDAADDM